jgi:hypothetical protein
MLKAEADHPTKQESKKVLVGEIRRHHSRSENIQNIEHIRIGDQWQVNEFLDLSGPQQKPDLIVFS